MEGEREHLCVWSKGGLEFKNVLFFLTSGSTCGMLVGMRPALKSLTTRSASESAFSCLLMALYSSLSAVLVPASDCGGK